MSIITKIFGTRSERELKKIMPIVDKIEALEPEYQKLSDAQLRAKTAEFRERLSRGETLDGLLPEAFAAVREAAVRTIGERFYRVQLIGGVVLHQGRIAEMKTGEGKTEVATLPAYLNALAGRGVHVVTVNDYLVKFQSEFHGARFNRSLGMDVGIIVHGMDGAQRAAPMRLLTYATKSSWGSKPSRQYGHIQGELVQRGRVYAIFDEVDSI
jgi:preprotein translocase subunit SecA